MLDFDGLLDSNDDVDYEDLFEVFESLDRHGSHTELRSSQKDTLLEINNKLDDKDVVLKLSTGAGKTAIGLLYLWSQMKRKQRPVLYLCPNNQLVSQVLSEAKKLGINANAYLAKKPHPPIDCVRGEAITVCTYDKLFNGMSTFRREDVSFVPCALVADDAHSGVDTVRSKYTLNLSGRLREKLINILDAPCLSYNRSLWSEIKDGDPKKSMEVPFWIWADLYSSVSDLLVDNKEEMGVLYEWDNVAGLLELTRCVVSGNKLEISPVLPDVSLHPAFNDADHRIFMSATLSDDSTLVKELSVSTEAALNPVFSESDKGLGERMVLAPSLISEDLDREAVIELCSRFTGDYSVVVLSPNDKQSDIWKKAGASIYSPEEFSDGVNRLKSGKESFAVFSQRYDGIDLADDACRILVIDGLPYGESAFDQEESSYLASSSVSRKRITNRIEQGMGRAVRSHVDYAVVLLVGVEIASYIAKKEVLDMMNHHTRLQLNLALFLSSELSKSENNPVKSLESTMMQCLGRNESWKKYYKQKVRDKDAIKVLPDQDIIEWAGKLRHAFMHAKRKDFRGAYEILNSSLKDDLFDLKEKAYYLQLMAFYKYRFDKSGAHDLQVSAYELNSRLIKPLSLPKSSAKAARITSGQRLSKWFLEFEIPSGAAAELRRIRNNLNYELGYELVESSLLELANLLGVVGSRPEEDFNEGPDVLWEWDGFALIIEAKNENEKKLHKKDAGQLLISCQWYDRRNQNAREIIPVIASKTTSPDRYSDYPDGTRVIDSACLTNIFSEICEIIDSFVRDGKIFATPENSQHLLEKKGLIGRSFINKFTVPLSKK